MDSVSLKLSGSDADLAKRLAVFPGWVLVRRLQVTGEDKTSGGIVLPGIANETAKTACGVVVKAGMYYEQRSGEVHHYGIRESGVAWPPPTGTIVIYTPHNEWQPPILKGTDYCIIKSCDLMLGVEQS